MKTHGMTVYRSYENDKHIVILFVYGELISRSTTPIVQVEDGLTYSEGVWMTAPKRDLAVFRVIEDKMKAQREILKEIMTL